jgi:hypothetical protein
MRILGSSAQKRGILGYCVTTQIKWGFWDRELKKEGFWDNVLRYTNKMRILGSRAQKQGFWDNMLRYLRNTNKMRILGSWAQKEGFWDNVLRYINKMRILGYCITVHKWNEDFGIDRSKKRGFGIMYYGTQINEDFGITSSKRGILG